VGNDRQAATTPIADPDKAKEGKQYQKANTLGKSNHKTQAKGDQRFYTCMSAKRRKIWADGTETQIFSGGHGLLPSVIDRGSFKTGQRGFGSSIHL